MSKSIFESLAVAERILKNRVCLSFYNSTCSSVHSSIFRFVCLGVFLELYHLFFFCFWHDARFLYEVARDSDVFWFFFSFATEIRNMGQKQGFLNLLKSLVFDFYWICSMMKLYSICCVPAQIPYFGKKVLMKNRTKCNHISRIN